MWITAHRKTPEALWLVSSEDPLNADTWPTREKPGCTLWLVLDYSVVPVSLSLPTYCKYPNLGCTMDWMNPSFIISQTSNSPGNQYSSNKILHIKGALGKRNGINFSSNCGHIRTDLSLKMITGRSKFSSVHTIKWHMCMAYLLV